MSISNGNVYIELKSLYEKSNLIEKSIRIDLNRKIEKSLYEKSISNRKIYTKSPDRKVHTKYLYLI